MFQQLLGAALATVAILGPALPANAASPEPLADLRWKNRVLLVAAATATDARLLRQRELFDAMRRGADERDLVLVDASGSTPRAEALRARYGIGPDRFTVVLIGKDGGAKLRSETPLGPDQLFATIDAMPMRQNEQRKAP